MKIFILLLFVSIFMSNILASDTNFDISSVLGGRSIVTTTTPCPPGTRRIRENKCGIVRSKESK